MFSSNPLIFSVALKFPLIPQFAFPALVLQRTVFHQVGCQQEDKMQGKYDTFHKNYFLAAHII